MTKRLLIVALVAVFGWTCGVFASVASDLGQEGGACLASWAPCVALHQAYSEYLFQGTVPAVPIGLGTSVRQTQAALTRLLLLLVEQPNPASAPIAASTDLLQQLEQTPYEAVLLQLAGQAGMDLDSRLAGLERAAEDGLFAMILDIKKRLDALVELLLQDIDEQDRYVFSAAFIAEGLIAAPEAPDIDRSWIDALAFVEDAPAGVLPADALDAIGRLVAAAEAPERLTSDDWQRVRDQATRLKTVLERSPDGTIATDPLLDQSQNQDQRVDFDSGQNGEKETATTARGLTPAFIIIPGLVIAFGLSVLATIYPR